MQLNRALEQHIAVFGESGSGKTVMVSSFYGATREPQFLKDSLFRVVADDAGQGARLHRNYLGMRDSARLPQTDHFAGTSYGFSVKLKDPTDQAAAKSQPFDALRLVWHDYPGEWFDQEVSGPEEAQRRIETFKSLLGSDVALLLVDGQRLLDNSGEESRYLKSLFSNFGAGLLRLRNELLQDGKLLVTFPRIWVLALSKADLLPDLDVYGFRDLMIEKAADDLDELRQVLREFVEGPEALSIGEDFMLVSSAKFEADRIAVNERVGLDLVLPLAATLPLERHVRWAHGKLLPGKVAEKLLGAGGLGAVALAAALLGKVKLPGPLGLIQGLLGGVVSAKVLEEAVQLVGDKLKQANEQALAKHNYLTAMLTSFRMDLDKGEEGRVFLRSDS